MNQSLRWHRAVWIVVRAAEGASLGLLAGALAAVLVLVVQWWVGEASISSVVTLCAAGAVCGAAVTFLKLPSGVAVAMRLDEQFGLHDLLSSALQSTDDARAEPSWRNLIAAQAEAAAGRLPRWGVEWGRLSNQTHAAAALAVSMVITVSAIASPDAGGQRALTSAARNRTLSQVSDATAPATPKREPRREGQSIQQSSNPADETRPGSPIADRTADASNQQSPGWSNDDIADSDGGASASRRQREARGAVHGQPPEAVTPPTKREHGDVAGGGASTGDSGDAEAIGGVDAQLKPTEARSRSAPPIADDQTPASRARGIPPAYQEMVRTFFARE